MCKAEEEAETDPQFGGLVQVMHVTRDKGISFSLLVAILYTWTLGVRTWIENFIFATVSD